jgi:Lysozyme like domain
VATITSGEIGRHAHAAGFSGLDLRTAVAVALAESGGNTNARNLSSREDSRGLWQINVRAHPEFASSNLFDPAMNARAAKAVLNKQGWGAWSVFKNGKFLLFMPAATGAVAGLVTTDVAASLPGAGEIASGVGELTGAKAAGEALTLAAKAGTWISDPRNWIRILYVALGGALVIGALVVVAQPIATEVAGPAVKTAIKAAK